MAEATEGSKRRRLTATQARAARRARRKAKKGFVRYLAFGAVGIVAVIFIVALFLPGLPFGRRGGGQIVENAPGTRYDDQGATHLTPNQSHSPYNSVPATSGWHYSGTVAGLADSTYGGSAPARAGVYSIYIPDEVLIHNLEHGGIRIHYNCPEGCADMVASLAEYAQEYSEIIVSPDPRLESQIALVAWNYLLNLDAYDDELITQFIQAHRNSGALPEFSAP